MKLNVIEEAVRNARVQETLDPLDPMRSARAMVDRLYMLDGQRTMHRYRGEFWHWQTTHYRSVDDEMIDSAIWDFLDKAQRYDKSGEKLVPFKPSKILVANVCAALTAICQLDGFIEAPSWLDKAANPPATEFVAVRNGLLHLPTRKLTAPTPTFFGLNASTVAYVPDAPPPEKWLNFLKEVLKDTSAIVTAQEWFGYALSPDTSQQKIGVCIGEKRSGKGTTARILNALLGKHSVAGPTMGSLGETFGLEPLIGKSLAIISDARIGRRTDKSVIVERLLTISGEDTLTVARKFKQAWTGQLLARMMILTNEMISLTDGSGALVGRYILFPFKESFYGRENVGLTNELLKELPGILNWAIDGYERLKERGHFIQPANATETIEAMEMLGAPIKAFIRDKCEVGPTYEADAGELYIEYCKWCEQEGLKPTSKQWFGRDLNTAVPGLTAFKPGTDERKLKYRGIRSLM
jgi:putative DNA primase/helicase